ncbi:hypothetical protein [Mucilaginibacter phyllosphaerae]
MKVNDYIDHFEPGIKLIPAYTAVRDNGQERQISIEAEDWQAQYDQYQQAIRSGRTDHPSVSLTLSEAAILDFSA